MAKKNVVKNLISQLAENVKEENKTLDQIISGIMKDVEIWIKENKKEYDALCSSEQADLHNPTFLVKKVAEIKITKTKLRNSIFTNLTRIPGNMLQEDKILGLYDTLEDFKYACPYSDTLLLGAEKVHLDHIIPVKMGGPTDDWNILPICESCNLSKSDRHLLDWWESERTEQEEFKLVKIFNHITSKILENKGVIYSTTLTEEDIKNATGEDYSKSEKLDVLTFLLQLKNHIIANKHYILNPKQSFITEKEKSKQIEKLVKEIEVTFNVIYKRNKQAGENNDLLVKEQQAMVKFLKEIGVVNHYQLAYEHFEELKQMQQQGKSNQDIVTYCVSVDNSFVFSDFCNRLVAYKSRNGHLNIAQREKDLDGYNLGQKIANIKRGGIKPSAEQIQKLEDLGLHLEVRKPEFIFEFKDFYSRLVAYKERNGHLNIKAVEKDIDGYPLGQKIQNIKSGAIKLDEKLKQLLQDLGLNLEVKDLSFDFEGFCSRLVEYKGRNGHLNIKAVEKDIDGYPLGRKIRRIKSNVIKLNEGQKLLLQDLGLNLEVRKPEFIFDFEVFYDRLAAYKKRNKHLNIKWNEKDVDGYPLGQKIHSIKSRTIKLDEKQKTTLQDLGLNLEVKDRTFDFEYFYNRLVAYKERNGHLNIKKEEKDWDGYNLGIKISCLKKGDIRSVSNQQKQKLIDLGLNLEIKDLSFDFKGFYDRLVDYKERNGHLHIKDVEKDSDGYPLGQKIRNIKSKAIKLDEKQKQQLIDLGLNLEVRKSEFNFKFKDFYSRLVAYKERNGHLNIAQSEKDLDGYLLGRKINSIKSGTIKLDKIQKTTLQDLGLNLEVKSKKKESEDVLSI